MAKAMKFGSGKAKRHNEGGALEVPEKGTGLKKETFKEAFRRNRRNKEKTFVFNGETFTTEYKEEKDAREAKEKAKEAAEEGRMSAIGDKYREGKAKNKGKDKDKDFDEISGRGAVMVSPTRSVAIERKEKAGSAVRVEPSTTRVSNPSIRGGGGSGGSSAASRQLQMGSELDPKELMRRNSPRGKDKARFNDDDAEFKKGGKVKKMASGGSASKRADGCAIRGKTRA